MLLFLLSNQPHLRCCHSYHPHHSHQLFMRWGVKAKLFYKKRSK